MAGRKPPCKSTWTEHGVAIWPRPPSDAIFLVPLYPSMRALRARFWALARRLFCQSLRLPPLRGSLLETACPRRGLLPKLVPGSFGLGVVDRLAHRGLGGFVVQYDF